MSPKANSRRYSGPAGMTEQDDMEHWNYASAASQGTIARRCPSNYQMALASCRSQPRWSTHRPCHSEGCRCIGGASMAKLQKTSSALFDRLADIAMAAHLLESLYR
jgi:hypothetical protein